MIDCVRVTYVSVCGLLRVFRVERTPDKDVYGIKVSHVNDISGHKFSPRSVSYYNSLKKIEPLPN